MHVRRRRVELVRGRHRPGGAPPGWGRTLAVVVALLTPAVAVVVGGPPAQATVDPIVITRFAGTGTSGLPTPGPATSSRLNQPMGVAVDGAGNVYIGDFTNNRVEKVDPAGQLSVFAGTGVAGPPTAGPATSSRLSNPVGVAVDGAGNVYIGDYGNHRVEKVDPAGQLSVFAGTGAAGPPIPGPRTSSRLNGPTGVAVDGAGNVYIGDYYNNRVEKVDTSGGLSVFAGTGAAGQPTPGPATSSPLALPMGVAVDGAGNVYVGDSANNRVEKVDTGGQLSVFAGTGTGGQPTPGPAASSRLNQPMGVAADGAGNVYIADDGNNRVEKVDTGGQLSLLAGTGSPGGPVYGAPPTSSPLSAPYGVAVDGAGYVYIADTYHHTIAATRTGQTITFPQPVDTPVNAGPVTVTATASSGLPVAYTSTTSGVCTVSGASVTLVSAGTCTIAADQAGDATWPPALTVARSFAVTAVNQAQTITFPQPVDTPVNAGPVTVTATASSGLPVAYTSTTSGVCTVSGASVTLVSAGTCTIQADQAGDATWAPALTVARSFAVTAVNQAQTITFPQPVDTPVNAGPVTVTATASSGLPVAYTSTTSGVCTVSGASVTLVSAGTCTIEADQAGDATWAPAPTVARSFAVTAVLRAGWVGLVLNQGWASVDVPAGMLGRVTSGGPAPVGIGRVPVRWCSYGAGKLACTTLTTDANGWVAASIARPEVPTFYALVYEGGGGAPQLTSNVVSVSPRRAPSVSSLRADVTKAPYGATVALTGHVSTAGGRAIGGAPMLMCGRSLRGQVACLTFSADAAGNFRVPVRVFMSADYAVAFLGNTVADLSLSPLRRISLR